MFLELNSKNCIEVEGKKGKVAVLCFCVPQNAENEKL